MTGLITIRHTTVDTARSILREVAAEVVIGVALAMDGWRGHLDFAPEVGSYGEAIAVTRVRPYDPREMRANVVLNKRIDLAFGTPPLDPAVLESIRSEIGYAVASEIASHCRVLGCAPNRQVIASRRLPMPAFAETGILAEYAEGKGLALRVRTHYDSGAVSYKYTVDLLYGVGVLEWR